MNPPKFKNVRAFQFIDTEEKAYWLGFVTADGSVTHGQLRLSLKEEDSKHIEKFKNFMQSENKTITVYRSFDGVNKYAQKQVALRSVDLIADLEKFGIVSGKATSCAIPNIQDELLPHWLRGYFDGDGCITFASNGPHISVCSGLPMLQSWQDYWVTLGLCKPTKIREHKGGTYVMQYGGRNQVERLLSNMYLGSKIYLDRKNKLFVEEILGN